MTGVELVWRLSDNGQVQVADSALTAHGEPLQWFLGGRDGYWGLTLTADPGAPVVWHTQIAGPEEAAKAAATAFETEHAGQEPPRSGVEILERYHLVGGGTLTRVAAVHPEPLYVGELNLHVAEPVQKRLRKARRDGKVLRLIGEEGIAVVPADQISYVMVVQRRRDTGEEFLGEPGWPQDVHDHLAAERADTDATVEHLVGLAVEYADKRAEQDQPGAGPAAKKATEAALEHLRTHLAELVQDPEETY